MQRFLQKNGAAQGLLNSIIIMCFGALSCLPVIFPRLGFLQWVAMVPGGALILYSAQNTEIKYRKMYRIGFLYFMGFYLTAFHWFVSLYPLSFIDGMTKGAAAVVVVVAWVGLSLLQTSVSAFVPVLIALLARRGLCERYKMLLPIGAAAVYTVFEWMQTLTWAGVPWARLAIGQTYMPEMLKTASLLGSYFLTFIIVAVNFYIATAIILNNAKTNRVCLSVAASIIAVSFTLGAVLVSIDKDDKNKFTAAAIQPNISSQEKWTSEMDIVRERVEKYVTEAAIQGAKLIVAPESVFPIDMKEGGVSYEFLVELAKKCDATLVIGCFTEAEGGSKNSLIFIDPDGNVSKTVYSKRHLVPFGEYVPMRRLIETLIPPLADLSMLGEDLIVGEGTAIYESEVGAIGSLICFDSIYETLTLDTVRDGAEILVISTNDSWFLDSVGVRMHNAQAKLRAVESGRYIVRSANTGISSIIDPNGEILDTEKALVEGYAIADVSARGDRTLYSYVGNLIVWASMAFVIASVFCAKKKED